MTIPTDRLREIANPVYVPCVGQDEAIAIATELLACREERDAANYRAEKAENDLRCVTLTGDAVASDSSLYRGNSVRYWYDKCQAYKNSAGELAAERERFNLLSQRCDAAERGRDDLLAICQRDSDAAYEAVLSGRASKTKFGAMLVRDAVAELVEQRDAARAELAAVMQLAVDKWLDDDEGNAATRAARAREAALKAIEAAEAELAAVKRQLDKFIAFLRTMQDAMHEAINALSLVLGLQAAQDWLSKWSAQAKGVTEALAAEQPKPQQPEVQP